eukprot:gene11569-13444_t
MSSFGMSDDVSSVGQSCNIKIDASNSTLVDEIGATDSSRSTKIIVPKFSRTGELCKKRHIKQEVKKTTWTVEEDNLIRDNHTDLGMRWSQCTVLLPGRSENAIHRRHRVISRKNYYSSSSDSSISPAIRPLRNKGKHHRPAAPTSNTTHSTVDAEISQDQKIARLQELLAARRMLDLKILELEDDLSLSSESDYF